LLRLHDPHLDLKKAHQIECSTYEPVLTVKTYKQNDYAHEAIIRDKSGNEIARVIYRPHKPLSCGARCWIETNTDTSEVELIRRTKNERT
jgi:hypothetical protein